MKNKNIETVSPEKCLDGLHELLDACREFLAHFENVFDHDWEQTKDRIGDADFVPGTFLAPGVPDESDNWANRGSLLASYRRLKQLLV